MVLRPGLLKSQAKAQDQKVSRESVVCWSKGKRSGRNLEKKVMCPSKMKAEARQRSVIQVGGQKN